ncbi:MAG: hypothetical protein HC802_21770 [Caldilineaceae bacterium]|nr:hypothetical protein [Caldilineaceae bacterium]
MSSIEVFDGFSSGYGASVGPNLWSNVRNGNGLDSSRLYADLITDSAGYVVSFGAGKIAGGIAGLATTGNLGAVALLDASGNATASVLWDLHAAPTMSSNLQQNLLRTGFFER